MLSHRSIEVVRSGVEAITILKRSPMLVSILLLPVLSTVKTLVEAYHMQEFEKLRFIRRGKRQKTTARLK